MNGYFPADLEKAKENNSSQQGSSSSEGAIDLSSHKRPPPPIVGGLNLKKESALLKAAAPPATPPSHHHHLGGSSSSATPSLDLTLKPSSKNEVKVSPFSAEALLSKSSSSSSSSSTNFHRPSEPSRMAPPPKTATPPRTSPYPHVSRASPLFSPSASQSSGVDKSRSSPWHTPVNATSSSRPHGASGSSAKPAIPVSPVVREDKNKDMSFQAALLGLGAASASMPPVSLPLPPTTYGSLQASLAANPYLAMAAAGMPKTSTSAAAASSAFANPMMDPTSAYYAALYSQSLYGLSNPYAAAAGMRLPGMPPSTPAAPPHPHNPAASAGAAASMDLLALQAMMSRGSSSSAAANPYAAAAAAAGYPPGLSSLFGLPGYPPGAPSGRKDP